MTEERCNEGEFSHAYYNEIDDQPGVFLYFNNAFCLHLGVPHKEEIIPELAVTISMQAYQKLRQYMIDNPIPRHMGL